MPPIKVALIGVGGYGVKLATAIRTVPALELSACYHPDKNKAAAAADRLGCEAFYLKDEIFRNNAIKAVIIASPDHTHQHYIEEAIDNNKHVFVEKPMVGSWEEALQLKKKVEAFQGIFSIGHNMRRAAGFRRLKKEYTDGLLGELVTFQITLSHGGALNWGDDYWRSSVSLCREGPLRVNGVHASDVLEYLFGPIDSVYAALSADFSSHEAPDSGVALVQLGKACGGIYTHWVVPSLNRFHFEFTDAIADYDLTDMTVRYGRDVNCLPAPLKVIELPAINGKKEQFEEFASAITKKGKIETGWREGVRSIMFFEACYRSQEQHRQIKIEELSDEFSKF